MSYGLMGYPGGSVAYHTARRERFPFAYSSSVPGGCLFETTDPKYATVWTCPECQRAEAAYFEAIKGQPIQH